MSVVRVDNHPPTFVIRSPAILKQLVRRLEAWYGNQAPREADPKSSRFPFGWIWISENGGYICFSVDGWEVALWGDFALEVAKEMGFSQGRE